MFACITKTGSILFLFIVFMCPFEAIAELQYEFEWGRARIQVDFPTSNDFGAICLHGSNESRKVYEGPLLRPPVTEYIERSVNARLAARGYSARGLVNHVGTLGVGTPLIFGIGDDVAYLELGSRSGCTLGIGLEALGRSVVVRWFPYYGEFRFVLGFQGTRRSSGRAYVITSPSQILQLEPAKLLDLGTANFSAILHARGIERGSTGVVNIPGLGHVDLGRYENWLELPFLEEAANARFRTRRIRDNASCQKALAVEASSRRQVQSDQGIPDKMLATGFGNFAHLQTSPGEAAQGVHKVAVRASTGLFCLQRRVIKCG